MKKFASRQRHINIPFYICWDCEAKEAGFKYIHLLSGLINDTFHSSHTRGANNKDFSLQKYARIFVSSADDGLQQHAHAAQLGSRFINCKESLELFDVPCTI